MRSTVLHDFCTKRDIGHSVRCHRNKSQPVGGHYNLDMCIAWSKGECLSNKLRGRV